MFIKFRKYQFSALKIVQQNIVKLKNVDAIVNAANSQLLPGGGVCGAIFKAAGKQLETECQEYIKQNSIVHTSNVAVTGSGNLIENDIRFIIHAVGPKYYESNDPENELYQCVQNILITSFNHLKLISVAIPAISSGIYGFPKGLCAQIFKLAIDDYTENKDYLKGQITLCNFDEETTNIFQKVFDQKGINFQ